MFMILCLIMEELNEIEIELNKIILVEYMVFVYFYVFVVELSNYFLVDEDLY